ncbi:hypothetical protein MRB53_040879 [Persea americana]|nr:hypothetical protein MRB53_040879 [Persea americana]
MSGRLLAAGLLPATRRTFTSLAASRRLARHGSTGGLLRAGARLAARSPRSWPPGISSIHNVPAVRSISFVRMVPSLFVKLLRIPALFGGVAIAGLAYIQYQAARTVTAVPWKL